MYPCVRFIVIYLFTELNRASLVLESNQLYRTQSASQTFSLVPSLCSAAILNCCGQIRIDKIICLHYPKAIIMRLETRSRVNSAMVPLALP